MDSWPPKGCLLYTSFIDAGERDMIDSIFEFDDTIVREIMVPRIDIVGININETLEDVSNLVIAGGHSRIPVYEQSIDNIVGVIYAKDLLKPLLRGEPKKTTLAELMRPAYYVPESKRVRDLFEELRKEKVHMAIILDEYGGTAGLITIEDLIEEIVGDIQDEYDQEEESIQLLEDGSYLVDARTTISELNELLDVNLSDEEYETCLLYTSDRPALTMTGIAVFLVICTILTVLYMKFYHRDTYGRGNSMLILAVLALITLFITKLIISINISSRPEIAELVNYLVPVAMGSMLMAILLDTKIAIFMTMLLSICVGLLTDGQLTYAIVSFVSGTVGIFSVSRFSQRLDWVRAGIYVVGANILTIAAINLLNNQDWTILLYSLALGILNGFFSTILAYGIAPFLESGFKVTTSVRLLELSNPSQPLLKRLLTEAPGTYHHSIMVANLSEAAADAIGADSLLVRAGAYYHDIGKLKRPYFFIENQLGGENPHEKLTPALSTLIITSHPKDGLELAQQYGLPPVITDLIYQHHGKGLASYFYHKAVELGNADNISEDDFRYDAAKPQTKEAAIIMLADSVEAAVRAAVSYTHLDVYKRQLQNCPSR